MSVANPDLGPDPLNRLADGAARRRPMSRYEIHNTFRELVRWELNNGRLSAWRRRKLVRYAGSLRISAVDAGELIQEVIRAQPGIEETHDEEPVRLRLAPAAKPTWPTWAKFAAVVTAVVLIQFILIVLLID
ncbi:MAG: hypothetical protein ACYSUQ_08135 [Planctomycetota bacterium]|jgi:hypothetical protein